MVTAAAAIPAVTLKTGGSPLSWVGDAVAIKAGAEGKDGDYP